jgi:putative glutamine amidotransferase
MGKPGGSISGVIMSSLDKPLIAVTGPDKTFKFGWWATRFMLFLTGLRAIYLTPGMTLPNQRIRGIIIGGGDDIEPSHYAAESMQDKPYNRERDLFEIQMINLAMEQKIPIMGICRGAQLINVVHKGTLFQDIRPLRKKTPNRWSIAPLKWVRLLSGRMKKRLAARRLKVNSLHNQAIKDVGEDLKVSARDEDDFVQAIEGEDQFILGVQWHPEYLPYKKRQRQLFAWFASAVRKSTNSLLLNTG